MQGPGGTELEDSVEKALELARSFLSRSKHPRAPSEVAHEYEDKYLLAEFLAKTGIGLFSFFHLSRLFIHLSNSPFSFPSSAGTINILEIFGLEKSIFDQLSGWPQDRPVILRWEAEKGCTKGKERKKDVETGRKTEEKVVEESGLLWGGKKVKKTTQKVITKVTEYDWELSYKMR